MVELMKNEMADGCCEHEHEWCEIPLHEESLICSRCGEIREPLLVADFAEEGAFAPSAAERELAGSYSI
jgi:hypothetical protein